MKSILLFLSLLGLLSGCNSTPSAQDAVLRVTMRRYKQAQMFELVSETHTDPKRYYSTLRTDANRKVLPDLSMRSLVNAIRKSGMDDFGQAGRAPTSAVAGIANSFEIQQGERVDHWAPNQGASRAEHEAFFLLLNDFLKVYSETESFQYMANDKGGQIFEDTKLKSKR